MEKEKSIAAHLAHGKRGLSVAHDRRADTARRRARGPGWRAAAQQPEVAGPRAVQRERAQARRQFCKNVPTLLSI